MNWLRTIFLVSGIWLCGFGCAQNHKVFVKIEHLSWSVIYDYEVMNPAVVYYVLSDSDFIGTIKYKPKHFKQDRQLPKPRVKNNAYTFSGYQRGHLCPAGDRDADIKLYKDTYYTSNVIPMTAEANAGAWKQIESACRATAKKGHRLKIACGGIGYHSTGVRNTRQDPLAPDSIWKIVACMNHPNEIRSWIIPNSRVYVSQSQCIVNQDDLFRRLSPVISSYIQAWIRK